MSTALFDRTSPHNLEAERSILGAVLLHEETLGEIATLVGEADFFRDAHRRIFKAMVELQSRRVAIDLTTLQEELGRLGQLTEIGGPAYITALVDGVPRSANIAHYARIVSEKSRLRQLIGAGNRLVSEAYEAEQDATDILERAEQTILGLADGSSQTGFESMRTIAQRAMGLLDDIRAAKGGLTGIPTGFLDLDALTHGFQPGTLVVLGARPGVGKSSLATNIAQNAASRGHVVGMFSLEMPKEELFFRQVAATARIDSHRLQGGYLSDGDWVRIVQAMNEISESSVHLDETPAISMMTVRSRARRLKTEHGLKFLIIDYLQLMGTPDGYETRALAISLITGALKALAKDLKIPILLLSQLNRESVKGEKPRRPQLSDLRDSGSIEQDADIVMFLHRSDAKDDDADVTELMIAKHRNGPIGTVKLRWHEQYTRFDNFTPEYEDRQLPMGER
jgi:replicative DNA helicase